MNSKKVLTIIIIIFILSVLVYFGWNYFNEKSGVIQENNSVKTNQQRNDNVLEKNVYTLQGSISEVIINESGNNMLIVKAMEKDTFFSGRSFEVLIDSSTKVSLQNDSVLMVIKNGKPELVSQSNGESNDIEGSISDLKTGDSVVVLSAINIVDKESFTAISISKINK